MKTRSSKRKENVDHGARRKDKKRDSRRRIRIRRSGRVHNVPETGNCFFTCLVAAINHIGEGPRVLRGLGMDALSVKEMRRVTPDVAVLHMGCDARKDVLASTHATLVQTFYTDLKTYRQMLQGLPQEIYQKYRNQPPETSEELSEAWIDCITEYKTYACEITVTAWRQVLRDLCGLTLNLVMAKSEEDDLDVAFAEGQLTLVHVLDIEHYMWVSR